MKKLISAVLALTMSMAVFTGCANKETEEKDPVPTPSAPVETTPTPMPTPEIKEDDPNYATVLAMWKDLDGYWANAEGEYAQCTLDDEGKAIIKLYDKDGNLKGLTKTTAVMSSTKTGFFVTFYWPDNVEGIEQTAGETSISVDMENYSNGYVKIGKDNGETKVYVRVGEKLDKLEDSVEKAATIK